MTSSTENVELKKEMGVLAKLGRFSSISLKKSSAWIRPTILGTEQVAGAISPADEVCYVLNYQSTADLLVVDHAAQALDLPRPLDPLNAKEKDHFLSRSPRRNHRQKNSARAVTTNAAHHG